MVIDPAPERAALAEPMLRRLDELGVPHVIFVNKIENARAGSVRDLIAELQPMSREPLALRQIPIRDGEHVTGYVDLALECFGPERLMYGSDWPVCELAASYEQVYAAMDDLLGGLSESERGCIFGGTAARFYGIA